MEREKEEIIPDFLLHLFLLLLFFFFFYFFFFFFLSFFFSFSFSLSLSLSRSHSLALSLQLSGGFNRELVKQELVVELLDGGRKIRRLFLFHDVLICAKEKSAR